MVISSTRLNTLAALEHIIHARVTTETFPSNTESQSQPCNLQSNKQARGWVGNHQRHLIHLFTITTSKGYPQIIMVWLLHKEKIIDLPLNEGFVLATIGSNSDVT